MWYTKSVAGCFTCLLALRCFSAFLRRCCSTVHDIADLAMRKERTQQGRLSHGSLRERAILARAWFPQKKTLSFRNSKPSGDHHSGRSARRSRRAHHADSNLEQRYCLRRPFVCRRGPVRVHHGGCDGRGQPDGSAQLYHHRHSACAAKHAGQCRLSAQFFTFCSHWNPARATER